jgi:hypothetical protein
MSDRDWRTGALLREAILNAVNPRSRTILILALAIAAGSTTTAFYVSESTQFTQRLDDLETRGSNIITLQSATPRTNVAISRSSCEALTRLPQVQRAGLLIDGGSRDIPELGANTRTFTASTTLFPPLATQHGLIGSKLSRTSAPRTVTVAPSQPQTLATGRPQPAGIPTNSAVVFPLPAGTSSGPVCIASLTRFSDPRSARQILAAALETRGGPILAIPQLPLTSDPIHDWHTRPGQYLPIALGLLGGLLSTIVTGTRSSELAAYRLSGTSRRSAGILLTVENLFPSGAFLIAGAVALITLALTGADILSPAELLMWLVCGAAAWSAVAAYGAVRGMLLSPAKMTREK